MGKLRAKARVKGACRANGPSTEHTAEELAPESSPQSRIPALEKLSDPSMSERQWACHSLSHLMGDEDSRERLLRGGVVGKVAPLLMDREMPVREAATSLLRHMFVLEDPVLSGQLVGVDVMTRLSAMLRDVLYRFCGGVGGAHGKGPVEGGGMETGGEGGPQGEEPVQGSGMETGGGSEGERGGRGLDLESVKGVDVDREQFVALLCGGLALLKLMSERGGAVVGAFINSDSNLLSVVLQLVELHSQSLEVSSAAAQLLLTVAEDNGQCIEHVLSSGVCVKLLMDILTSSSSADARGLHWPLKASVSGVLCLLMPHLEEDVAQYSLVLEAVLSSHVTLLDTNLDIAVTSPPEQLEAVLNLLKAKRVTMEVITNMAYVEEDFEDGAVDENGSDDLESMEVDFAMPTSNATPTLKVASITPLLKAVTEASIHEKVWNSVRSSSGAIETSDRSTPSPKEADEDPEQAIERATSSLLTSSLCALQNLVSALPVEVWGGPTHLVCMWSVLFSLLEKAHVDAGAVSSVLVALVHRTAVEAGMDIMSAEQVGVAKKCLMACDCLSVRSNMVVILGEVAKRQLSKLPAGSETFTSIVSSLRDCICQDSRLLVVCQALDVLFDVFGADECSPQLFSSLSLMPVLEQCRASLKARYQVEQKYLEHHNELVQNVRTNLPRFMDYMKSRLNGYSSSKLAS